MASTLRPDKILPGTVIQPARHVGPRLYHPSGVIPHPLQLSGYLPQPGTPTIMPTAPAGRGSIAALYATMFTHWPHHSTINGRSPSNF